MLKTVTATEGFITWPYVLRSGHSDDPSRGACAMDAVNWLVHGRHGDAPGCACPVIAAFVIRGNDRMPHDIRQRLLTYLHRISGSRSAEHEAGRTRVLTLAALRVFAPRALDAAGLHDHAQTLRALPNNMDMKAAAAAAARAGAAAKAARAEAAVGAARAAEAAWVAWAAAAAAAMAASAAAAAVAWDDYFIVLDAALDAGPQGEPWSADAVEIGRSLFVSAGGVAESAR